MKKSVLLSIAILSLLLFSSCSWFQKQEIPQATQTELQLEKKTGLISSSEEQGLLNPPTQFVLIAENGERIPLDSLSINFKRYKKRRVEIEGQWNSNKTIFTIGSLTSIGNETQVKQAYQNSQMGIKFSYPSIWILKEEKNVLGIQKITIIPYEVDEGEEKNIDTITIERSENNKRLIPRQWLNLDEQYRSTDPLDTNTVFQQSSIGIAQLDAVKKTIGTGEKIEFYVSRDTFIYKFSHLTLNDADKDIYRNAFFEIVASFEFIPFDKTEIKILLPSQPATSDTTATQEKSLSQLAAEKAALDKKNAEEQQIKQTVANQKQLFIDYIKQNIAKLAPETASVGGTWFVQSVQFAFPENEPDNWNAIYVVYEDGHDLRKILLEVKNKEKPEDMAQVAYFKPGDSTDWTLTEGSDSAKASEKSVVNISGNSAQEVVIKKGMNLLDAKSFKIKIQYPSSWYWAYSDNAYKFSNKPVTSDNVLLKLLKNPSDLPADMNEIEDLAGIKGKEATQGFKDSTTIICVQATDKYCLSGDASYSDTIKGMLVTVQE